MRRTDIKENVSRETFSFLFVNSGAHRCIACYMMSLIITVLFAVGCLLCIVNGISPLDELISGADGAVKLCASLAGSYLIWMGLMNVAKRAGLVEKLARLIRKPLGLLMPGVSGAAAPITMNLAANFFGLGNAATPFGIDAMRELKREAHGSESATANICMFLALNASAIELLPTNVLAIRFSLGAADAYSIVLPTLISSIFAAVAAIIASKAFASIIK